MWRHKGFLNPHGNEWFMSSCQHQFALGDAYESGYNCALSAILQELINRGIITKELMKEFIDMEIQEDA